MGRYLLKRALYSIPVLFGITLVSFFIIHLAPGKPTDIDTQLNPSVSQEAREKLERIYGFDKPVAAQYLDWIKKLARFDFGRSFIDGEPAAKKILGRVPVTLFINFASVILMLGIAVPVGVAGAVHRGSVFDKISTVFVFMLFSMPALWVALIFMSFFGVNLGWFPVSGLVSIDFDRMGIIDKTIDIAWHAFLPVVITALGGICVISRYMRDRMLGVLNEDYIRTARAKGLSERAVIYKHGLRNALLPIITIIGLMIPALISGSVIVETIFNIPGMGRLMVEAVFARDYNVIMAQLLFASFLTLAGNIAADMAYAYVDPRIRYK